MSPVWIIEGNLRDPEAVHEAVSERNGAERRFSALAEAVREHERAVRGREYAARPQDVSLYRRLRQICGEN